MAVRNCIKNKKIFPENNVKKDSPAMALMLAGADGKSSAVVQYTALLLQNNQYEL
jgi:hypothetical protein